MDKVREVLRGDSSGIGFIEVIIALAILGIIAAAFLSGLITSLKAVAISDERSVAVALAQGQMEYVKGLEYDDITDPPHPQYIENQTLTPAGYTVVISAERLDPEGDGFDNDDGIQQISITVSHQGSEVFTLEDYKINR